MQALNLNSAIASEAASYFGANLLQCPHLMSNIATLRRITIWNERTKHIIFQRTTGRRTWQWKLVHHQPNERRNMNTIAWLCLKQNLIKTTTMRRTILSKLFIFKGVTCNHYFTLLMFFVLTGDDIYSCNFAPWMWRWTQSQKEQQRREYISSSSCSVVEYTYWLRRQKATVTGPRTYLPVWIVLAKKV